MASVASGYSSYAWSVANGISLFDALQRAAQITGVSTRAANGAREFVKLVLSWQALATAPEAEGGRVRAVMESIVSRLRRTGALGRNDMLFETFFVLHNEPIQQLAIPGLQAEFIDILNPTTMFKLSGSVSEKNDGLLYMLHYDSNYLSRDVVLALGRSFDRLLSAAVASPDNPVFDALAEDSASAIHQFSATAD